MSEEELKQHGTATLMELLLKQARHNTFLKWIEEHIEEVEQLFATHYGTGGVCYILAIEQEYSSEAVIDTLKAVAPNKQQEIMTAAQQLEIIGEKRGIQKGIQQGRQEGMHTNSLNIARNMLSNMHLDMETVSQATGLSRQELIRLQEESKH